MTEKVELQVKARGERPEYFADPAVDKVLSITLALAGEVMVLRERLDTLERLLAAGDPVSRSDIYDYQPDRSVREARDVWRVAHPARSVFLMVPRPGRPSAPICRQI